MKSLSDLLITMKNCLVVRELRRYSIKGGARFVTLYKDLKVMINIEGPLS
jgi:hypothetical protein